MQTIPTERIESEVDPLASSPQRRDGSRQSVQQRNRDTGADRTRRATIDSNGQFVNRSVVVGGKGITMDVKRLRLLTIVAPITYILALEIVSILVLLPLLGNNSVLRFIIIFALLVVAAVPFAFWVFSTIERQQRDLAEAAAVLESVRDYAIFMLDPDGRIVTWSPGAERLKGYRADEIVGQPLSRFYTPEDAAAGRPERNLQRAAAEGRFEDDGWRVRKDGSRFWANVVSTALRDRNGELLGFTHVAHDITERREAMEQIQRLNNELEARVEELAKANGEIVRRNRQLDAVNSAIVSVSSALDLSQVLQNIVDAVRELVHSRYAALGVADENGHIAQFITSGITAEERAAIEPLPEGHGLLGALIKEGTPLRVADIAMDPRNHGFPPNHAPMKSLLGVPIVLKGRTIGDLYLTDKIGAEEFSQEDQDLVMLLANHAAVAIENARLYEESRDARDRLQIWNTELESKVEERTREIERYSKELTTRVLQAQEEERKRIARELHDDTAQSLSTLLINLDVVEPFVPPNGDVLRTTFDRVRDIAQRTLDSTRALSHDLRPTILDDFGLVAAIRWFADEYTKTFGVPVDVRVEQAPETRLPSEVELALFRIAQEALTNSGKYAEASTARVKLSFPDHTAELVVEDNGKGFDRTRVTGPTRTGGLGLYGMQERADLLGATLIIESAPGAGTRVSVTVPLPQTTDEGADHSGVPPGGDEEC